MWVVIMSVILLITAAHLPYLKKQKSWKETIVFFGFMVIGGGLWLILVYSLPFPNPTNLLENVFKPAVEAFFGAS